MSIFAYDVGGIIGEGAHGIVVRARNNATGEIVALKKILLKRRPDKPFPIDAFREVKSLQYLNHENIIRLHEVFSHGPSVVLAMEFVPHNLSALIYHSQKKLPISHIKTYLIQLLKGLGYCHINGIMHRDIKPANLLIDVEGTLKIADFGQACLIVEGRKYEHQVATRWYRAPELLYGAQYYNEGVDLWAVGCVFAEMLNCFPLFRSENDIEQLGVVLNALGSPTEQNWPGHRKLPDYNKIQFPCTDATSWEQLIPDIQPEARELAASWLVYDSSRRLRCHKALEHDLFLTEPLPVSKKDVLKPSTIPDWQPLTILPDEEKIDKIIQIFQADQNGADTSNWNFKMNIGCKFIIIY